MRPSLWHTAPKYTNYLQKGTYLEKSWIFTYITQLLQAKLVYFLNTFMSCLKQTLCFPTQSHLLFLETMDLFNLFHIAMILFLKLLWWTLSSMSMSLTTRVLHPWAASEWPLLFHFSCFTVLFQFRFILGIKCSLKASLGNKVKKHQPPPSETL